ncbi:MAG: hypothetical protein JWR69_912 [Pedosphaera sp.]|nr:hypothetical protein [Pedosphaera sp.]
MTVRADTDWVPPFLESVQSLAASTFIYGVIVLRPVLESRQSNGLPLPAPHEEMLAGARRAGRESDVGEGCVYPGSPSLNRATRGFVPQLRWG